MTCRSWHAIDGEKEGKSGEERKGRRRKEHVRLTGGTHGAMREGRERWVRAAEAEAGRGELGQ